MLAACRVASGRTILAREYIEGLEGIRGAAREGDLSEVRRRSRDLLRHRIVHGSESVRPDRTLLVPLSKVRDPDRARELAAKASVVVRCLRLETARAGYPRSPDGALLERLREEQKLASPEIGGDVSAFPVKEVALPEWLADRLVRAARWIAQKLGRLLRWLARFLPRRTRFGATSPIRMRLFVGVLVVVVIAVLALAVYYVLRNRLPTVAAPAASSLPAASRKDEDPLSRTATEWERYAEELIAAGRAREAIRAWYHAMLVTMFRAGVLHYRKGRTNWEYAYLLSPGVPWRSRYMDLTREFEREWYGRESSEAPTVNLFASEARSLLGALRGGKGG